MKQLLFNILIFVSLSLFAQPVVIIDLPGLLGNRLFGYCMAKIIAEQMDWKVYSKPIWGFPDTYPCEFNIPSSQYPMQLVKDAPNFNLDITPIVKNKELRNIKLNGYFQNYKTIKPYTNQIRNHWLKIAPELKLPKKYNSIVVHIRTQYDLIFVPFEFYRKALEMATYDQVYICADDPNHPFLKNFEPYNPIIVSSRNLMKMLDPKGSNWDELSRLNMDDFLFINSFDKIICSLSTYCWWAAFLSDATEIYAPFDKKWQCYKVEEDRYHYIETTIGR